MAILANGELLVSQAVGANTQLIAYPIVAATKTCGTGRVLTPAPDGGTTSAIGFMISPDGKEVAYQSDENNIIEVRAVAVDGLSPPRRIGRLDGTSGQPRYVGAGAFVSYHNDLEDAGWDAGGIAVNPVDGGPAVVVASGPNVLAIGNCS